MPVYTLIPSSPELAPITLGEEPFTIGRNPDNALALQDTKLSRYHCVIEPPGSRESNGDLELDENEDAHNPTYRVRDLGSRNGTRLNGFRIDAPSALREGDVLKIGSYAFTVEVEQTLAERQARARLESDNADPSWASDLREMIAMVPPTDFTNEEVEMIDARGSQSSALAGATEGALAVRLLLVAASKSRATDIHAEPKGDGVQVRLRVDGQMVSTCTLPNRVGELVIGLVKTACNFRPTARDVVLDGHFSARFPAGGGNSARRVDYRVSLTPAVHGQKLVMRVLDQRDAPHSLTQLGLPPYMHERVKQVTMQDAGLLLVCGPTGSGKTTTLYNALREIDREVKNVVTIEDPVEYHLDNVTQIPVNDSQGNTFGQLLRSVLRQDPDVILVGEIRDDETARVGMQAAMTGHLVFSTVHAKDTISSVFRLLDLNVEPYLVANSLEVIIAQRLVRVLCDNCKRPVRVSPGQATKIGKFLEGKTEVFTATGCGQCLRTGYRGRQAVFEVLDFTDELRDVVMNNPSIQSMKKVIESGLFTTLVQSGWLLAAKGVTSLEEVERVATAR